MCCENSDKLRRRPRSSQTTVANEPCFCDCATVKKLKELEASKKSVLHLINTGSNLTH